MIRGAEGKRSLNSGEDTTDAVARVTVPASTAGAKEMEKRIRAFDWSTTPLGPIQHWQQSLRTVVKILLSSRYAMWMAWGPELTMLYNDAYQPTLGLKHEWALGARANQVWAEIWPDIRTAYRFGAEYRHGYLRTRGCSF